MQHDLRVNTQIGGRGDYEGHGRATGCGAIGVWLGAFEMAAISGFQYMQASRRPDLQFAGNQEKKLETIVKMGRGMVYLGGGNSAANH